MLAIQLKIMTAVKKLNQYNGILKSSEIVSGINAAIITAKNLLSGAKLLQENKNWPLATSIACLSIEESGKVPILRRISLASQQKEVADIWKEYRSHKKKNNFWITVELILNGASELSDFKKIIDKESEHPYILDNLKQLGIYSDCLGSKNWSIPTNVVDEKLCNSIIKIAEILCPKKLTSEIETKLWIKHLKGINDDDPNMKKSLYSFWIDMHSHGLFDDLDGVKKFLGIPEHG